MLLIAKIVVSITDGHIMNMKKGKNDKSKKKMLGKKPAHGQFVPHSPKQTALSSGLCSVRPAAEPWPNLCNSLSVITSVTFTSASFY
jgi:hypothetical protein